MLEESQGTSLEALRDIARRSGLTVGDERLEQLGGQLPAVLQNIHRLDALDLSRYEPATALHVWQE